MFTKTEKYVILFLIAGALFGIGHSYYKQLHGPIKMDAPPAERRDLDQLLKEAGSVNINTASREELMRLDGIGPVLAGRIVEYRQKHGNFTYKEEIKDVPGMGNRKFEAIESCIEIE